MMKNAVTDPRLERGKALRHPFATYERTVDTCLSWSWMAQDVDIVAQAVETALEQAKGPSPALEPHVGELFLHVIAGSASSGSS